VEAVVSDLPGRPDFVFEREDGGLAVFVHGCFWHCCPKHWRLPKTRRGWWARKFAANRRRDRLVRRRLNRMRFGTMAVWEHDVGTADGADRVAVRIGRRLAS
jgi:DNA mismatch endonuclease (patch repair protein)